MFWQGQSARAKLRTWRMTKHGAVTCCHVLRAWGCICLGVNLCFFVPSPCSLHVLGTSVFLKAKSLCFFKFLSLLGLCLLSFLIGSNAAATDAVGLFSPSSQVIGFVEPKPLVSEWTLQWSLYISKTIIHSHRYLDLATFTEINTQKRRDG